MAQCRRICRNKMEQRQLELKLNAGGSSLRIRFVAIRTKFSKSEALVTSGVAMLAFGIA